MKRLILFLVRLYADDRNFRIAICKELHKNAQNYFGDQTVYGRYYEACGEFFEADPVMTSMSTENGVVNEFRRTQEKLKDQGLKTKFKNK